jgi:signal peptidase
VTEAASLPSPGARFAPLHQLGLTVAALGELGAVEPFRPLFASVLERRRVQQAPGPLEAGASRRARPSTPNPQTIEGPVPVGEPRADPTATPLGRRFFASLRRPANVAFAVVLVAVVATWWVAFRPTDFLGGPATFITVKGTSMLPMLKTGDFVLADAQPAYHVGDLVVYRVPKGQIGAGDDLIHRIVAGSATTGFTLKGDNNPAPDPWIVPRSDVLGKEALAIPGLGNSLLVIRSPLFAGLAAALIAMWLVISPPGWMRRRKPASAAAEATPPTPAATTPPARGRSRTSAKPVAPAASPATRPRPARRTRAPRREP